MNWELIHRLNALVVGVFVTAHLGVHMMAIHSPEAHAQGLGWMRQYYSHPLAELVLILALLLQLNSGWAELRLRVPPGWRLIRNLSGLYLTAFILIHVGSVFYARHVANLPTDFYWAAGGFVTPSLALGMGIFFGLGVFSFFAHLIAVLALARPGLSQRWLSMLLLAAAVVTTAIWLAFSGQLYAFEVPADISAFYERFGTFFQELLG